MYLRTTLINPLTTDEDLAALMEAIRGGQGLIRTGRPYDRGGGNTSSGRRVGRVWRSWS